MRYQPLMVFFALLAFVACQKEDDIQPITYTATYSNLIDTNTSTPTGSNPHWMYPYNGHHCPTQADSNRHYTIIHYKTIAIARYVDTLILAPMRYFYTEHMEHISLNNGIYYPIEWMDKWIETAVIDTPYVGMAWPTSMLDAYGYAGPISQYCRYTVTHIDYTFITPLGPLNHIVEDIDTLVHPIETIVY